MDWSTLGFLALVLVCPIAMMLMMRGGHGHGGAEKGQGRDGDHLRHLSNEQLHEISRRAEEELAQRHESTRSRG